MVLTPESGEEAPAQPSLPPEAAQEGDLHLLWEALARKRRMSREPTLDSISEQKIQEAIDPIIQSRTSILIAHRLSTILAADEILVVKDGQIVERGQHKALVAKDGVYRELYETQFSKALLPEDDGPSELEQYIWGQQAADEPDEA